MGCEVGGLQVSAGGVPGLGCAKAGAPVSAAGGSCSHEKSSSLFGEDGPRVQVSSRVPEQLPARLGGAFCNQSTATAVSRAWSVSLVSRAGPQ